MAIRGLLFDKDGTLIEMNDTWIPIYRAALPKLAPVSPSAVEAMLEMVGFDPVSGKTRPGSILGAGTTRQLVEAWWPNLDPPEVSAMCRRIDNDFAELAQAHVSPLLPLGPLFGELRQSGFKLGLGTNDSHASAVSQVIHLGIDHYFDAVIAADTVTTPKPSGDMIRAFAEKTGLQPIEIAMVGDNSHDMEEARHGGAGLAIAVLSGNAAQEDIAHLADHVLDSIAELPKLLRAL